MVFADLLAGTSSLMISLIWSLPVPFCGAVGTDVSWLFVSFDVLRRAKPTCQQCQKNNDNKFHLIIIQQELAPAWLSSTLRLPDSTVRPNSELVCRVNCSSKSLRLGWLTTLEFQGGLLPYSPSRDELGWNRWLYSHSTPSIALWGCEWEGQRQAHGAELEVQ